ncbi:MAG: acyl--CoA ligase [Oscillospiraceae bacterium]|nr:acyl--CoA ligase [Oscillospiraceae bacterium]
MAEEKKLTGYPSIDKPWLKYYSEEAINAPLPECTMYQYIWENNKDHLSDIALRYYGAKISYGQLFENIKKAANAFSSIGIRAGDIVTIMSMHTPETIYAIYGLNYIGAVANMVYMTLAEKEILYTVENTESKLLLMLDAALVKAEAIKNKLHIPVVMLGVADSMPPHIKLGYRLKVKPKKHNFLTWKSFLNRGKEEVPLSSDHEETAIIVYTSGTTGVPKGVMLSNAALNSHSCQELHANFGFVRGKTFMHILPPFVGFGISHIHLALNAGIDSFLWIDLNADAIANAFFRIKPVFFVGGPALIDSFLKHRPSNLSKLELFVGGGEALAESKEQEFNQFLKNCHSQAIYANGYGMTETSSTLCCNTTSLHKTGSIGLPMPRTNVKILDPEDGHELKYGEVGELCFSTPNMMSGYYRNDEDTIRIISVDESEIRWIHTGDIGTVDEDGFVYVKGRIKRIEITRGEDGMAYKLFPLHIEETVVAAENVEKCAVIICDDANRINVPIIFVSLKQHQNDRKSSEQALWNICQTHLPSHEQPVAIHILDDMPMTPSGKIDYRALEEMAKEI